MTPETPDQHLALFPPTGAVVRIAEAFLELLRGDDNLRAYFGAGPDSIFDAETEDLLTATNLTAPSLAVVLDRYREAHFPGHAATGYVTLKLVYLTRHELGRGTRRFLRARVLEHLIALVNETKGELRDPDGQLLTTAVIQWDVAPVAGRLQASGLLALPLTLTLQTELDRVSREVIYAD
jgi:hypothetical protein